MTMLSGSTPDGPTRKILSGSWQPKQNSPSHSTASCQQIIWVKVNMLASWEAGCLGLPRDSREKTARSLLRFYTTPVRLILTLSPCVISSSLLAPHPPTTICAIWIGCCRPQPTSLQDLSPMDGVVRISRLESSTGIVVGHRLLRNPGQVRLRSCVCLKAILGLSSSEW